VLSIRVRVARRDDQLRCQRFVDRDDRLATEALRGGRDEVPEASQDIADVRTAIHEPSTHDAVERMEAELEPRRNSEVPAGASQSPEQLCAVVRVRADDRPVRDDELRTDEVVAGQSVLGGQVADAAAHGEPADAC
jgi:hypothetical protein